MLPRIDYRVDSFLQLVRSVLFACAQTFPQLVSVYLRSSGDEIY